MQADLPPSPPEQCQRQCRPRCPAQCCIVLPGHTHTTHHTYGIIFLLRRCIDFQNFFKQLNPNTFYDSHLNSSLHPNNCDEVKISQNVFPLYWSWLPHIYKNLHSSSLTCCFLFSYILQFFFLMLHFFHYGSCSGLKFYTYSNHIVPCNAKGVNKYKRINSHSVSLLKLPDSFGIILFSEKILCFFYISITFTGCLCETNSCKTSACRHAHNPSYWV